MERGILAIALAYLLGSLPFSYIVTRWRAGLDIRYVGEGNVGARNVFHVVGPGWGALVALLDVAKAYAAYLVARALGAPLWAVLVAGFALALGHGFPIFLKGRGGKGVGVTIGFLLGMTPLSTLAGFAIFGLAHLLLKRDFNRSVTVGVAAIILLPRVFGQGVWMTGYALALFLMLAVKKVIDLPHERRVWAQSPWQGSARPGWYREGEAGQAEEVAPAPSPIQHQL